jgi:Tetracyclin repressor-like, C-terminal domain
MARYVWRVGALAELDRDQVVRYVAPTIQRYLTGRLVIRRDPGSRSTSSASRGFAPLRRRSKSGTRSTD